MGQQLANGNSEHVEPSRPAGYKKAKAAKHDENNRRPPRPAGQKKVCQCCYRSGHDIFDLVCKRCLRDKNELAKVEQEIAAAYPATSKLTSAQIMRRLWESNKKLTTKLKASVAPGRVGHR